MKRRHVHQWRLVGHGFGAVRRYQCTSCTATREEERETQAEQIARMEDALGIPAVDRIGARLPRDLSTEGENA